MANQSYVSEIIEAGDELQKGLISRAEFDEIKRVNLNKILSENKEKTLYETVRDEISNLFDYSKYKIRRLFLTSIQ